MFLISYLDCVCGGGGHATIVPSSSAGPAGKWQLIPKWIYAKLWEILGLNFAHALFQGPR